MRTYGRRYLHRKLERRTQITTETRDAVLWDIDWDNFVCRVKIQGSNEYVNVHFPRNDSLVEGWMRPGNAVRIIHRGGVRGYAEIVGHGHAIPTPLTGPFHPETSDLADAILTGCGMSVAGGMSVYIEAGTVRIGGESYDATPADLASQYMTASNPPTMSDPYSPMEMGNIAADDYVYMTDTDAVYMTESEPMDMGIIAEGTYTIDAAPAEGYFRYDAFVVGADGVVDYIKGTAATSNPTKPSIPTDHVLIGDYIFVIGGTTELLDEYIGQEWEIRRASSMTIDELDEEWEFNEGNDYPEINIIVRVYDQYGWAMSLGDTIILYLIGGSGQIYSVQDGYASDSVSQYVSGSSCTFKYQRDQTDTETSPSFLAVAGDLVSDMAHIALLNELGLPVSGSESSSDIQDLTSAAEVTINWLLGQRVNITAAHDITFVFSGAVSMDKLIVCITQPAAGGMTITWPASVRYGAEITEITISTEANSASYVGFIYHAAAGKYDVVANVSGYGA